MQKQKTMKKVLSLVLSLLIIMPCVGIIPVNATGLDRTELDAVIEQAKAINTEEYVDVSALNAAVETASGNLLNTQTKIDDATAKIELEIAKLEKVKGTTTVTTYAGFTIPDEYSVQTTVTIDNVNGAVNVNKSLQPIIGKVNMTDDASAYVYTDLYKGTTISDFGLNPTIMNSSSFVRANEIYLYFNDTSTVLYHFQQKDVGYNNYTSYGQKKQTIEMEDNVPAKGTSETVKFYAYNTSLARTQGWFGTGQNLYLTMASYDSTSLRNALETPIRAKSNYSTTSYNAYIDALKKAMNVINTPITTVALDGEGALYEDIAAVQTAYDNAAKELTAAYDNLELTVELDYANFDAVVALAKEKVAESDEYVSVDELNSTLNTAQNLSYSTQTELDDMTAKIELEIAKLEKINNREENTITARAIFDDGYSLRYEHYVTLTGAHGGESLDSGVSLVYANQTTTVKSAKAYVYADKYSTSSLKDLGLVGSARTYCHVGKWFGSYLSFNDVQLNSVSNGTKGQWQGLGNHTLDAELPEAGTETEYQLTLKALMWDESKNVQHNGIMGIDLSVNSYDTTALREAIAKPVDKKSDYSIKSYAAYVEALENAVNVLNTPITTVELDGEGANYADITAAQTAIDNAAKVLNDAYNALQKNFNIEYYNDGVLFKTQTVSYADNETTLLSDVPSKTGYVFLNTWKASDGNDYTSTKVAHEFATEDGSTVRLDANYREAKYTVKFDLDGDTPDVAPAQYDYNTEITLPDVPTKTGFTFAGWKIGDKTYNAGDKVSKLATTDGDTVTISAQWNENSYIIHFDANGGDQAYTDVELKYTKEYIVPAAPTLTGHAFTGWLGSDGKLYAASQTVSKLSSVDGSVVTLTAQWDKVVYNVSLEKEPVHYTVTGLDSTIDAVYGTINFKVTVDPAYNQNELIVDAVNATITPLADGSYQLSNATGNVIVKISDHSKINTYTVKFTDGENDIATFENVEYGSKVNVPDMPISKIIEKDGVRTEYFFIGWLVNGKKVDDAANYAITADTTFVAQYSAEEYVWVTFMSQDGSTQLLRKSVKKGEPTYYGLTAPTKAATAQYTYTFVGWNTDPNSESATYSVAAPIPTTSEITVYAAFSKALRNYKVTLPAGEGYIATEVNGLNLDAAPYGTTVTYTVAINRAYSDSVPVVRLNGEVVTAKSVDNNVYTFEFVVMGTSEITVDTGSVKKNVYTAVLPTGTGFTVSAVAGYDATKITDGDNFCFTIALDKAYSKSNLTVKYNGEILTAVDGVYTISNVTANIAGITVEGAKINTYTVNFVDGDGNIIQTSTVEYGKLASYLGATPTKTPTATVSYKFIGWDSDPSTLVITDDTTFTAQFEESEALILTVNFVDDQGNVLKTYKTIYGGSVVYDGEIPEKAADEAGHFEFVGWDKGYANVTSNMTIRPKFVQKNHNPSEVRKEATCGVNGYVRMVCDDCGYIISEKTLVATGHHYGDWVTTVQPTHTTNGRQERKCTVCGDVELEILSRLPDHEYVTTVKVAATCTEDGIMLYKCACGDSYEKVITKLGHVCDEWAVVKEATCTEAGSETGICSRCNSSIENTIPAKGHNVPEYKDNGDGTSSGTCSECGEKVTIKNPDTPDEPSNPDKPSSTSWFMKIINWFKKIFKIIKGWFTKKNSIEIMY